MIFYLHGFASSPHSSKAAFFRQHLSAHGLALACPDFNAPDFRSLTMTRMLSQLGEAIGRTSGPATLIGSSLGGALAILAAAQMPERVSQLVLLAPYVMFAQPDHELLPPERMAEWKAKGTLSIVHHGANEERLLDYRFHDDALSYDVLHAVFNQPALVFQGRQDASVDCHTVEQFVSGRSRVSLRLFDDDHSLHASLPSIWQDMAPFLGLVD
ncbi:MAG: alpha/beta fold hydrolase [Acidobacteriaceae bacterium]|nr:alpha/beta fold hydrolase [Acidobacteriaceae bacterium]